MDKERFGSIQIHPLKMVTDGLGEMDKVTECVVDYRDWLWLISTVEEQTERAKEWELVASDRYRDWKKSEKGNARLRETLEFYADDYNWHDENVGSPYQPVYESDASRDGGEKARQALKQ